MSSNGVPFVLVSSETLPLTKELAIAHRDMPASPTERTYNEKRAQTLARKFERDQLLPCQWAKATWKGKSVRMNGQHSSRVLADIDPFPTGSFVHMDVYEPTSEEGMAMLFRQFDARVSGRSATDCSHAYQGLFNEIAEMDEIKSLAAIKGINRFHKFTGEGEVFSGDDLGRMYFNRSYDKFISFVNELLSGKCKELKRDEVLAATYGTFLASESKSRSFWQDVKTAHKDGYPSAVLDGQLERNAAQTDSKKKLKPVALYAICVKAWNSYLSEEAAPSGGWKHTSGKALPEIHSA
jgi:hypothetical protein